MGKAAKKRLRDEAEAPATTNGPLHSALEALPRLMLLELRRDLALGPFDEALRRLGDSGRCETAPSEAACEALRDVGEEASVEALAAVLGLRRHCWGFTQNADAVDAACHSLKALLQPDKMALLEALKHGAAFCGSVKRHLGKHDGQSLMKLGKPRVMWLLGADPDDPATVGPNDAGATDEGGNRRKRRRKRQHQKAKQDGGNEENVASSGGETGESDEDSSGEGQKNSSNKGTKDEATLAFLQALRSKRQQNG